MREVTVATPTDRVSAEVAVSLLHAMKIPARMVSAIEPVWTIGSISGSLADLRVVAPEDRAAEARALLGEQPERAERRSVAVEALVIVTVVTFSIVGGALLVHAR